MRTLSVGKNLSILLLVASSAVQAVADEDGKMRTPQFPLKTQRELITDEQIALARQNVQTYSSAKTILDNVLAAADAWVAWPDADLRGLIPSSRVPRAFNVGTAGCPKCGKAIYEKGGTYPWIIDPKQPFKVKCPVCGDVFPGNDYAAYYRSGLEDKQYLEGDYADDGWGWVGPDGHRYWFVGYANHWTWQSHILPGVLNLARAYVLTGDKRYAHKAVLMLDRIAEVYPGMDYHTQSRYGQLQAAQGAHYGGKIVNLIWETGTLRNLAESYDAVWETVDGDAEAQTLAGKTGEQIRANIEANILEEGIDAYFAEEIRGNFGMHQCALVYAVAARQYGKVDEWLGGLFTYSGPSPPYTGLNYALYNLVYRDGLPYETSPGYNWSWVQNITTVAETLRMAGRSVYAIPKTKRLYDGVLDLVNVCTFTPAVGDSGSVYGGIVGRDGRVYQAAYRAYHDTRYLEHLAGFGATGDATFVAYENLFQPALEAATGGLRPQRSRLLDGYGMAILNNPGDTVSVSMYYGYRGGHGHFDRLHFDVFAHGQPMTPDTGYPDFMNAYVSGIYTWSKNTIAHNTVTVDAGRQSGNQAGTVHLFADGPFARVIDVDAPETYPQCSTYRRALVMVAIDEGGVYFVDIFTVEGGHQHDYSLHGPPGTFEVQGGEWDTQQTGTLAGEDVPLGKIYDDPVLGAEDYAGVFHNYMGSGFQHMVNVRRHKEGDWVAGWTHEKAPEARLRIRIPDQPGQEIILADAQVSPVKNKQLLTYLIARRRGDEGLTSRFVGVIEPFRETPRVKAVRRAPLNEGNGIAVVVELENGNTDLIVYNPTGGETTLEEHGLKTDAGLAVARVDNAGTVKAAFIADGTSLRVGPHRIEACRSVQGEVVAVEPGRSRVRIRLDGVVETFSPASLDGRVAHFTNSMRKTAHPVAGARMEGGELVLSLRDDLLVGRAHLTEITGDALLTDTAFMFAPVYRGTAVADGEFTQYFRVHEVTQGRIALVEPLPEGHAFAPGEDVWIVNVGPGDRFELVPVTDYPG